MKLTKVFKFQFLFVLVFLFVFVAATPLGAVSYDPADFCAAVPPQAVSVQTQNGVAVFDTDHFLDCPGRPKMPVQVVRILLPEDADLDSLTYTLKNVKELDLGTGWEIDVAPPFEAGDGTVLVPKQINLVDGKDSALYSTNAFYPPVWAGGIRAGHMRRFKVAHVQIYPYRYNPVTKALKRITSATLMVSAQPDTTYVPLKNPKTFSSADATSLFFLKENAANMYAYSNSSDFDAYYPSFNSAPTLNTILQATKLPPLLALPYWLTRTYVVLTTNYVVSGAPSQKLEPFVLSKEGKFFDVTVVTQDKTYEIVNNSLQQTGNQGWGGNWGQTGAENIRNWLTADVNGVPRWEAMEMEHLLLIGCADPDDGTVPMKITDPYFEITEDDHPYHNHELPTDLYYSELTENWISPASGKVAPLSLFFDAAFDLMPEVSVTRIPVANYGMNVAELDDILHKIIAYSEASQSSIGWRQNMLLPMKPVSARYTSWGTGESLKDLCIANGFDYHRIYDVLCGYKIDKEFADKLQAAVDSGVVDPSKVEDYQNTFQAMKDSYPEDPWFSAPGNWQTIVNYFQELNLDYNNGLLGAPQDDNTYNDNGTRTAYNEDVVRAAWLAQDFGFVEWSTHGTHITAVQVFYPANNGSYPPLDNDHPSFVFMNSCLNGNVNSFWHLGHSIAYELLHHGAIGTIAASKIIFADDFNDIEIVWATKMVEGQLELGAARTFTVAEIYPVDSDHKLFAFNPYGDSTVGLFTYGPK
jgi:hypothetical protein